MALVIDTVALPDPPTFTDFIVPPNLRGGYFQVTTNPARIRILYGRSGARQDLPDQILPVGSYSIAPPGNNDPIVGIRAQNAVAGIGATFGGYFWTTADPQISYVGSPSTSVVGTLVIPRLTVAEFQALSIAGLTDQQAVSVLVDAATGTEWLLHWNAGSAKWDFIGGAPLIAQTQATGTAESTNSAAYVNLATVGPSITIPLTGDYEVEIGSGISGNAGSFGIRMSFAIGAAAAGDNESVRSTSPSAGGSGEDGHMNRIVSLTNQPFGTALVAKYRTESAVLSFWTKRYMKLNPIRVVTT